MSQNIKLDDPERFYSFMISDYRRDNDQTEDIVCIDLSGSTPRTLR